MPWDLWHKAAAIGLTSFMLPEELGGGGMTDCLTGCVVQEELCHGCSGIGNLITSNGFFAEPVLALGDRRAAGALAAPARGRAAADDRARDDRARLRLRRRVDAHDRARASTAATCSTGRRRGSPTAASPSCYVVFATVAAGQRPPRRHRVRARARRRRACAFGAPMRKMGQRAILNTELFLEDVLRPRRTAGSAPRARASAG